MVNKPAALYLEDAALVRQHHRNDTSSATRRGASSPPVLGTLRPLTFISADVQRSQTYATSPAFIRQTSEFLLASLVRARQQASAQNDGMTHDASGPVVHATSPLQHSPKTIYAYLDTGFFFECHVSQYEIGSYISLELFNHISPRPELVPARQNESLRYNGELYIVMGHVTFAITMTAPEDQTKQIELKITASVLANIYPDLFLGRDRSMQQLHTAAAVR